MICSDDGKLASANSIKANPFCKEYASVSRLPKDKVADKAITLEARRALSSPYCCTTTAEEYHPCSPFSYGELLSALGKLPYRSASGPDEISNTMLRNLSPLGRRAACSTQPISRGFPAKSQLPGVLPRLDRSPSLGNLLTQLHLSVRSAYSVASVNLLNDSSMNFHAY